MMDLKTCTESLWLYSCEEEEEERLVIKEKLQETVLDGDFANFFQMFSAVVSRAERIVLDGSPKYCEEKRERCEQTLRDKKPMKEAIATTLFLLFSGDHKSSAATSLSEEQYIDFHQQLLQLYSTLRSRPIPMSTARRLHSYAFVSDSCLPTIQMGSQTHKMTNQMTEKTVMDEVLTSLI